MVILEERRDQTRSSETIANSTRRLEKRGGHVQNQCKVRAACIERPCDTFVQRCRNYSASTTVVGDVKEILRDANSRVEMSCSDAPQVDEQYLQGEESATHRGTRRRRPWWSSRERPARVLTLLFTNKNSALHRQENHPEHANGPTSRPSVYLSISGGVRKATTKSSGRFDDGTEVDKCFCKTW
jgi:hypothetical protein